MTTKVTELIAGRATEVLRRNPGMGLAAATLKAYDEVLNELYAAARYVRDDLKLRAECGIYVGDGNIDHDIQLGDGALIVLNAALGEPIA